MSDTDRRGQLVNAAAEIFLQKGYRAATMADIAQRAGMSKKTVYQVFAAKSELFDGLLAAWFAPVTIEVEPDGRPPREVLTDALCRLIDFALSERQIAMIRLLIAETPHSDDIADALERQGLTRGRSGLQRWLTAEATRGTLRIDDAESAASTLFHTAGPEEIAVRVQRAVAMVCRQGQEGL
jgi:AcrR family transcriptional regulator